MTASEGAQRTHTHAAPLAPAEFGLGELYWGLAEPLMVVEAATGRVLLANPGAEWLVGAPDGQDYKDLSSALPPENLETCLATLRTATQGAPAGPIELTLVRPDGAEALLELRAWPVQHARSDALALLVMRDITQQRRRDTLLQEKFEQAALRADVRAALAKSGELRPMLQDCAEAIVQRVGAAFARIWTLNTATQVLELEASAGMYTHLNGGHGRVPVGALKIGLIAAERKPHLTNQVVGDPRVNDQEWAKAQGMVAFAGYPLITEGEVVGVVAMFARHRLSDATLETLAEIADDIAHGMWRKKADDTLRQRAEELARSNADLEQFAYVASHDLQEPLRTIVSYLQLIEKRYRGQLDDRADRYIAYAVDGSRRMQALINDLLSYSRVGRRDEATGTVSTSEPLERAIRSLQSVIEQSGATVNCGPLPELCADGRQMTQLFQNLLGNALKFHGAAPPLIDISAERDGREWRFCVRDNGIGLEMQYSDRIFVLFQRLHSRNEYEGTGIGLALCKKIVERHGGRIWVESTPGQGSSFYFTLPAEGTGQ
ncbi:MAG: GAF domain-containing protein [Chloroflexi bacterium]|nr:GAF domain-containing protein [Chloroflexota bacterium]